MDDALDQLQLERAAEAIVARGEPVNLDTIRAEVGATSYGAIVPLLQEWRIKKALTSGGPPGQLWGTLLSSLRDLSDDVDAVASAIEARWAERAAAESSAMGAALSLARDESQRAEAQVRELRERLAPLEAEARRAVELTEKLAKIDKALAQLRTKAETAEQEKNLLTAKVKAAQDHVADAQIKARKAQAAQAAAMHRADISDEVRKQADQSREAAATQANEMREKFETQAKEMDAVLADLETRKHIEEEARLEAERAAERQMAEGEWLLGAEDWPELPRQLAVATARMAALRAENGQLQERLADVKHTLGQAHKLIALRLTERQPTIIQNQIPMMAGGDGMQDIDMPRVSRAASGGGKVEVIRRK